MTDTTSRPSFVLIYVKPGRGHILYFPKTKLPVFLTGVPPETSYVQSYIDIAERYRSRLRKPVSTPKQYVNLQWSTAAQLVDICPNAPTERVNGIRKSEKEIQKLLSGGRSRRNVFIITVIFD